MVRFPPVPKRLSLGTVLRLALSQVPSTEQPIYRLRRGLVEITASKRMKEPLLLDVPVEATFQKQPLAKALDELSESSGVTIVIDCRVADKAKVAVTARFINGVSLKTALRLLMDMTELRYVVVDDAVYVTSPANAERLEKEQRKERAQPVPAF